jgi:hypothetical protein
MSTSSWFVRALSCSAPATRRRTGSSSSLRALSCSAPAARQHDPASTNCAPASRSPTLAPADQPYQPLPQTPWPTPPDGDPRRRAAEAAVASRAPAAPAKLAGRVRTESPRPASNRAHPARSPTASPETARTRTDRPVAATGHAFLSDPQGRRTPHRRPSFRSPSAQRSQRPLSKLWTDQHESRRDLLDRNGSHGSLIGRAAPQPEIGPRGVSTSGDQRRKWPTTTASASVLSPEMTCP